MEHLTPLCAFLTNLTDAIRQIGGEFVPSHGSLSKAGKIRSLTPKVEGRERHSDGPRVTNRNNYHKRFVLDRGNGQYKPGRRRRRRRR